ncbi:Uncharacterised protein [Pseudomonas luteola]|uniref:Uncharacterized protein n=2 Tax=Pseudomonas TaxID=286 RepID=A0A2X2CAK3_PSELU|nr:hypothetical protein SAMN05216409_12015 [Pseudomonas lutea]SPZ05157.1 Uncharacterised protein [Pseudomonas luteola]
MYILYILFYLRLSKSHSLNQSTACTLTPTVRIKSATTMIVQYDMK